MVNDVLTENMFFHALAGRGSGKDRTALVVSDEQNAVAVPGKLALNLTTSAARKEDEIRLRDVALCMRLRITGGRHLPRGRDSVEVEARERGEALAPVRRCRVGTAQG
jgi:hypothetical protein